jgi:hypothetical protein
MTYDHSEEVCRVPMWIAFDIKGNKIGEVYGYNERDALMSIQEDSRFDKYHAITVRKITDIA